ncbi:hypothetical protein HYS95_00820 [Candidatus Daviesbacteria bacterium]|nr:hypothetical protein [Candidatus Daviesbacteria bacterium]
MNNSDRSQLYKEEIKFIFSRKGSDVRRATVISAFIEWQIFSLASHFLEKRKVAHKPEPNQEYNQSFNVLKVNKILALIELEKIQKFRRERNKSIHSIFKGMTRIEWERQNKLVIELGRPIVKALDKKLYSLT